MLLITDVLRLARRLHAVWSARVEPVAEPSSDWKLLEAHYAWAQQARHRIQLAVSKNLNLIMPQLRDELSHILKLLGGQVEQLREAYNAPPVRAPDLVDWVRDLRQLEEEFGAVEVRWSDAVIHVVTDSITLNGVRLGEFAVDFHWDHEPRSLGVKSFEVIAMSPNSASGRDDITHPHVQDGLLCAGEAVGPLKQAVAAGRLADAFLLVRGVLSHYNPNSAYVSLAEWDGFLCADCRRRGDRDGQYTCEGCESSLCDECAMSCSACSVTRCADCLNSCDFCRDHHCSGCLTQTDDDRTICNDCRSKGVIVRKTKRSMNLPKPPTEPRRNPTVLRNRSRCRSGRPSPRVRDASDAGPLVFAPLAWLKFQFLCHAGPTEVAGFGLSHPDDPLYLEDVLVVRQRCTLATVAFDDVAVADHFDAMADAGIVPARHSRVWLHTHPGSSVDPSGTDEATFARVFGGCDWAVMAILGRTGRTSARLRLNVGPGASIEMHTTVDWDAWPSVVAGTGSSLAERMAQWQHEYATLVEIAPPFAVDPLLGMGALLLDDPFGPFLPGSFP